MPGLGGRIQIEFDESDKSLRASLSMYIYIYIYTYGPEYFTGSLNDRIDTIQNPK